MRKMAMALTFVVILVAGGIYYLHNLFYPTFEYQQVYIRSDGSIEPSTTPINRDGEVYTLQSDIVLYKLFIEKSNMTLDGNGFSVKIVSPRISKGGPELGSLNVSNVNNVTLKNLNVTYQDDASYQNVSGATLTFENSAFCEALNNKVHSLYINNGHDILISGNEVMTEYRSGGTIQLTDSTNCTITSNLCLRIRLHNSPGNIIRDNQWNNVYTF
jgi:hypothetical protein